MPRKVFCACGQALAVPDNYPKPVARCSACGGTVQIPPAPNAAVSPPTPTAASPYGTAPNSPYGVPPQPSYGVEPSYGQAPPRKQVSHDTRVLWVIMGFVGVAVVLFCGCGGILYVALSGGDGQQAARPQPPVPQPNIPQPNFQPPNFPQPSTPPVVPTPPVRTTPTFLTWRRHVSNSGWYECDLPGNPRTQSGGVDGVRENKAVVDAAGGEFSVRYYQADELMAKEGGSSGADAIYRRAWKRENTNGRDITAADTGSHGQQMTTITPGRRYQGKFLQHQGRAYELSWSGPPSAFDTGNWMRFSNSFQFRADFAGPVSPPTPPVVAPTVTPPPVPPPPAKPALDDFAKRRIYIPVKFKRQSIELLRKSQQKVNNPQFVEATQRNIDRMTEELNRDLESAARTNNLTREQVDAIIREGEEKKW